jgi:hypothetical protein
MNSKINFDRFSLPFMDDGIVDSDDYPEASDVLDQMEAAIPEEAKFIGVFEDEVDNWTSWKIEDHYYIIPLIDDEFEWALFRISWDDNHGQYNWSSCARLSGISNQKRASRFMMESLFQHWRIDLNDPQNSHRKDFIDEIR